MRLLLTSGGRMFCPAFCVSLLILGPGCTKSDSPEAPPASSRTEVTASAEPPTSKRLASSDSTPVASSAKAAIATKSSSSLVEGHTSALDLIIKDEIELVDPAKGEWVTEVFAVAAQKQLDQLAALISSKSKIDAASCSFLVGASFSGPSLAPRALEDVYKNGPLVVRRATALTGGQQKGEAGLAASLTELVGVLGADAGRRILFEISGVEMAKDFVTTSVIFEAVGRGDSRAVQQSGRWSCRWKRAVFGAPILETIRVDRFTEAVLEVPGSRLFAECTEAVLGDVPSYREQLIHSMDYWTSRVQITLGMDFGFQCGLAIGDANGDGLDDIYLCQSGGLPNRLLIHQPDGTLVDRSKESQVDYLDYTRSALFADLDNDGDQDLALGMSNILVILENVGSAKFEERAALATEVGFSLSALDVNGDKLLDIFVCGYSMDPPVPYHDASGGKECYLYQNDGEWQFENKTASLEIEGYSYRFAQSAVWEDYDNDGAVDLYVLNDHGKNNLFRRKESKFEQIAEKLNAESIGAGRAAACADFNHDGWMDFFIGKYHSAVGSRLAMQDIFLKGADEAERSNYPGYASGNALLLNKEGQSFQEIQSDLGGAQRAGWTYDTRAIDIDNNGAEDVIVANGFFSNANPEDLESFYWRAFVNRTPIRGIKTDRSKEYAKTWMAITSLVNRGDSVFAHQRDRCFLNIGKGKFADVSAAVGFDTLHDGRALGVVDWDFDGDLDVWMTSRNGPTIRFLRNECTFSGNSVSLRLQGTDCNRDAIGARVDLLTGGSGATKYIRTVRAGDGYLSQSSKWLHFGLGSNDVISRIVVKWPGGTGEQFVGAKANGRFLLVQGEGRVKEVNVARPTVVLKSSESRVPTLVAPERTPLAFRVPTSALPYQDLSGKEQLWDPSKEGGAVIVLWSSGEQASVDYLQAIAGDWKRFQDAKLGVLALNVDALTSEVSSEAMRKTVRDFGFPFTVGFARPAAIQKLELIQAGLFNYQPPFPVSTSFMVESDGYMNTIYRAPVSVGQLLADAKLERLTPAEYVKTAVPIPGRRHRVELAPGLGRGNFAWLGTSHDLSGFTGDSLDYYLAYRTYFNKVWPEGEENQESWRKSLASVLAGAVQRELFRANRGEEALEVLLQALELRPDWSQMRLNFGDYLRERHEPRDYKLAVEVYFGSPSHEDGYSQLAQKRGAWLLCCCEDENVRDTERGLTIAQEIYDSVSDDRKDQDPSRLDLLAACMAANGDFDTAIKLAIKGSGSARSRNAGTLAKRIEGRLKLYREKKPYVGIGGIRD